MRWTLKLELVREDGATEAYDLGSITRSVNDVRPEEVGLTLEEARTLVRSVECRMIADQVHAYTLCCRRCPDCGRVQQFKDVRTKCVQTIHGSYRFRGRRITACPCQVQRGYRVAFLPLGELIPRRTTPELRFLFAELGARMPYREASRVLQICGFGRMRASRMAIWRHTLEIGKSIDADQRRAALARLRGTSSAARAVSVGIDDTYIRHHQRDAGRQIQVTGGRIERNGKLAERFAFVSSAPGWTPDQFKGLLRQHGIGTGASMRVISDGDDGLRNFVQSAVAPKVTQQLDWFHIGMRLERLRKSVQLPMSYEEFVRNPGLFKPLERRVSRIRDSLWRGRPWRALLHLAQLRRDARQWADGTADRYPDVLTRLNRAIDDFSGYIGGNRRAVPDFARARAAGRRISTAHVESVMNHLINHRMSKKQQMRWSPAGAHYLLQVRADVLNGLLVTFAPKVPLTNRSGIRGLRGDDLLSL